MNDTINFSKEFTVQRSRQVSEQALTCGKPDHSRVKHGVLMNRGGICNPL